MTVVVLQPSADTWINKGLPTTNYGAATELQDHKASQYRVLMKFDLSGIPATAHIQSAVLSLYVDQHSGASDLIDPTLHPLTKDWTETGATWNMPWTAPGGDFDTGLFAFFSESLDPASLNRAYTGDITPLVQAWVEGAVPNFGLIFFKLSIGSSSTFGLNSREGANPPTLTVTYTDTGLLTPPDTLLPAGLLSVVDNHPVQHPDQDITKTFQDAVVFGGTYYPQPSARPLTDASPTWVDAAIANGFTPVLSVGVRDDQIALSYADLFEYFASVATLYAGKVTLFNISAEEPNNTWFSTADPLRSPAAITEIVRAAHDGILSVIPTAKIGFMQLGGTRPYDYLTLCVAEGLANYTDFWGNGQQYTAMKFNALLTVLQRQITNARFRDYALAQGAAVDGRIIAYQEEGMMKAVADSIAQAKVAAIKTVLNQAIGFLNEWYKLYDPTTEVFRIALFNADNTTTPFRAFYTLARLNQFLSPRSYAPVCLGSSCTLANVLRLGFKASDTDLVLALWNATATPTDSLTAGAPANVTVKDYGLIPLKIIDPVTGTSTTPSYSSSGGRLTVTGVPVTDYPTLILFGPSGAPAPPTPTPQPGKKKHQVRTDLCA